MARDSLGCRVDVVVPYSTTYFTGVPNTLEIALHGVEQRCFSGHGIITQALVAVHHTGDRVTCQSAPNDTCLDGERSEGRRDVVGESFLAT